MTGVEIAMGVGTAIVGMYSANKASQNATDARNQQMNMYNQGLAKSQEEEAYYRARYGPMEDQMLEEANGPLRHSEGYGLALGAMKEKQQGQLKHAITGSDYDRGTLTTMNIEGAKSEAGLALGDYAQQANKRVAIQQALLSRDLSGQFGMAQVNQGNIVGNALGQQADNSEKQAGAGATGISQALGSLAKYYGQKSAPDTTTPASGGKDASAPVAAPVAQQGGMSDIGMGDSLKGLFGLGGGGDNSTEPALAGASAGSESGISLG